MGRDTQALEGGSSWKYWAYTLFSSGKFSIEDRMMLIWVGFCGFSNYRTSWKCDSKVYEQGRLKKFETDPSVVCKMVKGWTGR